MAETKVVVPIGLNEAPTQPAQAQEKPAWARKSLHAVRMPRQEVQLEPQWQDDASIKWREVEQRAEPQANTNTPPQYTQPYQRQENYMENRYGNDRPLNDPTLEHVRQFNAQPGPPRPDPSGYDMYDPADVAAYQQANDAYMQSVIDQRVQAALQPHMGALQEAELRRDYDAALARYGEDESFQDVMKVALENCAEAAKDGKRFSIVEEYQKANDASAARPGQRGNAHLPEALRDKKRGIGMLGRIMQHNAQTGRAKPFGGRNWKG